MLVATLLGLALAAGLLRSVGVGEVADAASAIGGLGFFLLCVWSLLVLVILGLSWFAVAPGARADQLWIFIWGRTTREAASDVLPFSHLGGLIVGGRTATAHGIGEALVFASMVADITTEMASQLLFTLMGVGVLALRLGAGEAGHQILWVAAGGLGLAVATTVAFMMAQSHGIDLVVRVTMRFLPRAAAAASTVQQMLRHVYRHRGRVAASFFFNLLGWIVSGAGAWIALRFMGADLSLWAVLTIESLIFAIRSAAFFVPGALGLQEAGYVLIGPVFGLGPEVALALSLLKRARDISIGVPALIVWQLLEGRRLLRPKDA